MIVSPSGNCRKQDDNHCFEQGNSIENEAASL